MLYDDLDFVMDPILAGMCKMESAENGDLSLLNFAQMNDALEARRENERRAQQAAKETR